MVYTTYYDSPVGSLLLAEEDGALVGLWMEGQKYFLGSLKRMPREERCTSVLRQTKDWLEHYFAGGQPAIGQLPLAPKGSAFQQEVWRVLCDIPYGHLTTYGEIARKIAAQRGLASMSAQAVGGAVGHNPISIVIPCHRVVGAGRQPNWLCRRRGKEAAASYPGRRIGGGTVHSLEGNCAVGESLHLPFGGTAAQNKINVTEKEPGRLPCQSPGLFFGAGPRLR